MIEMANTVLELTGVAEKVDRPEMLVIQGRTGVKNILDELPPRRDKIEL